MQPTYQNVSLIVEAAYDKSKKYVHLSSVCWSTAHGPTPRPQPGTFLGVPKLKPDGIFSLSHSCFKILVSHKNEKKENGKRKQMTQLTFVSAPKSTFEFFECSLVSHHFSRKFLLAYQLSSVHLTYLHHRHNISLT